MGHTLLHSHRLRLKHAIVFVAMGCKGDGVCGGFAINFMPNTFVAVSPCNRAGIVLA